MPGDAAVYPAAAAEAANGATGKGDGEARDINKQQPGNKTGPTATGTDTYLLLADQKR